MTNFKKKSDVKKTVTTKSKKQCFSLYIAGASPNSSKAVANITSIFDKYLPGKHDLEIVDVHQDPSIAKQENIIAIPSLIRTFPLPLKRFIGNMSDHEKIVKALSLNQE